VSEKKEEHRTVNISIKLTEKEAEAVRKYCSDEGLTISEYIRALIRIQHNLLPLKIGKPSPQK